MLAMPAMKAAVLHELGGPLVVENIPRPSAGADEVIVRVRACGLGLTLAWNRKGRNGAGRLPRVIGHEIAGEVAELGAGVAGFALGDRVTVYYQLYCGSCRWCAGGREDLCDRAAGHVGRDVDGGLAEWVRLPARNLVLLPPAISYVDAAIAADAVATPVHVLKNRAQLRSGETALVIGGGGGVGIHMVQLAKLLGATVAAADLGDEKLSLARESGADWLIDARQADLEAEVRRLTEGQGVDVVVDMVGTADALAAGAASLGRGGRMVIVGSYDREAMLPLRHSTLKGERSIIGTQYCTRADLEEAIDLVASGKIRPVVPRTCGLEEADDVLRRIERMEQAGRACVVFP